MFLPTKTLDAHRTFHMTNIARRGQSHATHIAQCSLKEGIFPKLLCGGPKHDGACD